MSLTLLASELPLLGCKLGEHKGLENSKKLMSEDMTSGPGTRQVLAVSTVTAICLDSNYKGKEWGVVCPCKLRFYGSWLKGSKNVNTRSSPKQCCSGSLVLRETGV